MSKYEIEFLNTARRSLRRLSKSNQKRVVSAIEELADNPRPLGYTQLSGTSDRRYRIRIGDYRIVYKIEDNILLVLIVNIGHRREIYR